MIRRHYVPLFQDICRSEKLADLPSDTARLFYTWLLTHLDAYGRCDARPRWLNAAVWPMLGKPVSEVASLLEELAAAGLVEVYESERGPFVQLPDWEEKAGKVGRSDRRGESEWPDPATCKRLYDGSMTECGTTPSKCGTSPASRARLEPSRAEPNKAEKTPPTPPRGAVVSGWQEVLARDEYAPLRAAPGFSAAWERWIAHAQERGTKAKVPGKQQAAVLLNRALRSGVQRFEAAVEASIANNWQGVNPDWNSVQSGRTRPTAQDVIQEAVETYGVYVDPRDIQARR